MTPEELKKRTNQFALRMGILADSLPNKTSGRVLSRQIAKCGTSTAANYRAAWSGGGGSDDAVAVAAGGGSGVDRSNRVGCFIARTLLVIVVNPVFLAADAGVTTPAAVLLPCRLRRKLARLDVIDGHREF